MHSQARKFPEPSEMEVADILSYCAQNAVPVNTRLDMAIAAHRTAFADFAARGGTSTNALAAMALHAVVFASSPVTQDEQDRLAYLSALPLSAWENIADYPAEAHRQETLAGIERRLKQIRDL